MVLHSRSPATAVFWIPLAVLSLLAPPFLEAQEEVPASTVFGTVADHETGDPLAGAAVSLASGPGGTQGMGTRVTDEAGRFLFRSVPPGTYRVVVTLLGYRTLRDTLTVEVATDLEVVLPLSVSPIPLAPLVVEAVRRSSGAPAEFEERARTRIGTFITREEIERLHPFRFSDLLRRVPGATLVPSGPTGYSVRLRGGCRPELILDGVPTITIEGVDDLILPMDVEAVEVYRGAAMPVEFGSNPCGAIVVWTRRGEPTPNMEGFWKRAALALTFVVLAFLATR